MPAQDRNLAIHLGRAATLAQSGQTEQAFKAYEALVERDADCAPAWLGLGRLALGIDDMESALQFIGKAVELQPDDVAVLNLLADTWRQAGNPAQAALCLRRVWQLQPLDANSAARLAGVLVATSDWEGAKAVLDQALTTMPQAVDLVLLRAMTRAELGDVDGADADFRQVTSLRPKWNEGWLGWAEACCDQKRWREAEAALAKLDPVGDADPRALRLRAQIAVADKRAGDAVRFLRRLEERVPLNNLDLVLMAAALADSGDAVAAIDVCTKLLGSGVTDNWIYETIGVVFARRGQWQVARENLEMARDLNPDNINAWNTLIIAYSKLGLMGLAAEAAREVLQRAPEHVSALMNQASCFSDQGKIGAAVECFQKALALGPDRVDCYINLLFTMLFSSEIQPAEVLALGREFDRNICAPLNSGETFVDRDRESERLLRVGWLTSDLNRHAVGAFIGPFFCQLDPAVVESYVYHNTLVEDDLTEMIRPGATKWANVYNTSDADLAAQIRADRIDILVDLNGATGGNRLLVVARRVAPVQVTWLGCPATTGMSAMDYILVPPDPLLVSGGWCQELPWALPDCYGVRGGIPAVPVGNGMPFDRNGHITFACMNKYSKVSAAALDLWGKILSEVDGSRLILVGRGADDPATLVELYERFERHGVAVDRLTILGFQPYERYLETYNRVDLCLDPFPFNGGTTGTDSMWMGVPFVTMAGDALHSRLGLNILRCVGLSDLVASTPEEYLQKAVRIARNPEYLRELRLDLRQRAQASPLMDTRRFADGLCDAFRGMWRKWCSNNN